MNKPVVTWAAVLLAITAGVLLYVRSASAPVQGGSAEREAGERARFEAGQRAFAPLVSVAVEELPSAGAVRVLIESAPVQQALPAGAGPRDDLLAHVSEFVYHRFIKPDVAEYLAWREQHGYTLIPWAELDSFWGLGEDYAIHFGPVPEGIDSRAAFERFWEVDATRGAMSLGVPTRMVSDPRGLSIMGGSHSRDNPAKPRTEGDPAAGGLSADVWDGRRTSGFSRWHGSRGRDATMQQAAIMRGDGSVIFAEVSIILVFEGGTRIPFRVGCAWDPELGHWSIETLLTMNAGGVRVGPKVF